MMSRGGVRSGAGRKPALTALQRMSLGADCESRFNRYAAAKLDAAVASALDRQPEYDAMMKEVHSIPVGERADWLSSEAASDHRDDVEGIMRSQFRVPDDFDGPVGRGIHVRVTKPYGVKRAIIDEVAAEAALSLGISVSSRLVRECWDEFRKYV